MKFVSLVTVAAGVVGAVVGCRRDATPKPVPAPVSITTVTSAPTYAVAEPTRIDVEGDRPLHVVHAPSGERRAIVYLHGKCSGPERDIADMKEISRAHGTLVALEADQACPEGGTRWIEDETKIQPRIDAALAAVTRARNGELDDARLTLIGESQGASRAEALARRYAERYPYVVLFGAPTRARPESFARAEAVAIVAGERESQADSVAGADALENAGIKARFFEIPLAPHGTFGQEGGRVMDEALTFLGR